MKIVRGFNKIKRVERSVVCLGVFDGVHRGHRNILKAAVRKAHSVKGKSVVLTFWPHPQKEESLYSLEHRIRLIEELGIDVCIAVNFNKNFSEISALDFVKNILLKKIGACYVYIGENFRFGRGAEGRLETLKKLSKECGFKLKIFKVSKIKNRPISSTYIRTLIKKGDLMAAQKLLMRPVSILGTVIRGASLGRRLGFPTANINPHHEIIPPFGVYAVKVIFEGKRLNGICNIGIRPTFKREDEYSKTHIELHVLDFSRDIYGKDLEVQFIKKIRDEKKFNSAVTLIEQIKKDIKIIRKIFSATD